MAMIKRVLIIRFRRVGDSVLSSALCTSLRRSFPSVTIDMVLNKGIDDLFEDHPDIDNIITFNSAEHHNLLAYIARVRSIVNANNYDVIVDMRSTVKTLLFSLLSLHTPYRIGIRKAYNFLIHNYRIDIEQDKSADIVTRWLSMLSPLEAEGEIQYSYDFRLHVPDAQKQVMHKKLQDAGIDFFRPVILVAVAARLQHKMWRSEYLREVLQRIMHHYDAQLIFNYAGVEEPIARQIYADLGQPKQVFIDIQANSLKELAALTANCDFFFGNEGGPRHIAQALQIPSFGIFPPGTKKARWLPNQPDSRYQGISVEDISADSSRAGLDYGQQFDLINVETVWQPLKTMLDNHLVPRQYFNECG